MYNIVFIVLGIECNFKCRYCLQTDNVTEPVPKPKELDDKVIKFLLDNSERLRKKNGPNAKTHIQLWGGEPLLHWESLKNVVDTLDPTGCFTFGLITNGSLLTDDKVEFLNKHSISIAISHDGPNNKQTRLIDVFDNPSIIENFLKVKAGHAITSVVSAFNPDYYMIWDYFDEKFSEYGERVNVNLDLVMDTWNMPEDLTNINPVKYSEMLDGVMNNAYKAMISTTPIESREYNLINPIIGRIRMMVQENGDIEAMKKYLRFPKCGIVRTVANIDMMGNVYLCHNSSEVLGTVEDPYETIMERFKKYNKFVESEKCKDCEILEVCGGGCILVREGIAHDKYCELHKIFYEKIIDLILKFNNI